MGETQASPRQDGYGEEHVRGLEVPRVTWWKHKGLRTLYMMMPILFLGATVNGYDSSLLNGLQTLTPWQNCAFPESTTSTSCQIHLGANLLYRLWASYRLENWAV